MKLQFRICVNEIVLQQAQRVAEEQSRLSDTYSVSQCPRNQINWISLFLNHLDNLCLSYYHILKLKNSHRLYGKIK